MQNLAKTTKKPKLTAPQKELKARFDRGERIEVIKINEGGRSETFEYRFQDGTLCRYRTFWNLIYVLHGRQNIHGELKALYFISKK